MKKFKVYGNVNVVVTKEVWANSPEEAMEKAQERLSGLTAYCGNGGYDKLVGVENSDESVDVFDDIVYDDAEEIEDDPDYFECPSCEEECEACESDDGFTYWHCPECDTYYDEDGDEFYPDVEDDE
jgi:transcription elongation factor Elf1